MNTASPSPKQWLLVAVSVFTLAWGGNHFTPLLYLYNQLGHYSPWQVNLLLGTYVFGLIPGLLAGSTISTRLGRRPALLAGLLAGSLGSILLAFGLGTYWLLCIGRVFAGIGVGFAMGVGVSWIKELSSPPYETNPPLGAGARRPSLTLTLGFAIGAAVTGTLAQWGPAPTQLPYAVHLALCAVSFMLVLRAPETVTPHPVAAEASKIQLPGLRNPRFLRLVVPAAPWVFGVNAIAYAVMPEISAPILGHWTTLFATILTIVTLGCGAFVQPFVARLDVITRGRALLIGMLLTVLGLGLAWTASIVQQPSFALLVAVVLGLAYGTTVVACLAQVQRIATPGELATLTGIFYAVAYTGFLLPTVMAAFLPIASYATSLGIVSVMSLLSLGLVGLNLSRLPR